MIAVAVAVTFLAALYGYRIARAERHRAFDRACAVGDASQVALLLRLGADPDGIRDARYYSRYGWSVFETTPPLFAASSMGHKDVVALLLASGADPSTCSVDQMTARDAALLAGHSDVVQALDEFIRNSKEKRGNNDTRPQ
jgi:ankyrin repeat protein